MSIRPGVGMRRKVGATTGTRRTTTVDEGGGHAPEPVVRSRLDGALTLQSHSSETFNRPGEDETLAMRFWVMANVLRRSGGVSRREAHSI